LAIAVGGEAVSARCKALYQASERTWLRACKATGAPIRWMEDAAGVTRKPLPHHDIINNLPDRPRHVDAAPELIQMPCEFAHATTLSFACVVDRPHEHEWMSRIEQPGFD
jgi:hypothetical protein